MTEEEWVAATDAHEMIAFLQDRDKPAWLQGRFSQPRRSWDRKLRLFMCACCRRILHVITDHRSLMALEVTECFADGKACAEELEATCNAAWAAYSEFDTIIREQGHARLWNWTARTGAYAAACTAFGDYMEPATSAPYEGSDAVAQVVSGIPSPLPDTTNREAYEAYEQALYQQRAIHSSLLREIFGNPFRPVPIAPAWRTSTVTALAQAIYDERAFDRLPILADALEDVGCSNHDILDHCRGPGPHVRGCWVVDLLLD